MRLIPDNTWAILTIYQEAESEPFDGKVAVAEVILRRTMLKYFSDGSVASTCLWPHQFSGWNTISGNRLRSAKLDDQEPIVQECEAAWTEAQNGSNSTKDALHYLNRAWVEYLPTWASADKFVIRIGHHDFYVS